MLGQLARTVSKVQQLTSAGSMASKRPRGADESDTRLAMMRQMRNLIESRRERSQVPCARDDTSCPRGEEGV